jgi:hypothetical protein
LIFSQCSPAEEPMLLQLQDYGTSLWQLDRSLRYHAGRALWKEWLVCAEVPFSWAPRHCPPVRLYRSECSRQLGRASALMMPHRVHTMRGPNIGTGT